MLLDLLKRLRRAVSRRHGTHEEALRLYSEQKYAAAAALCKEIIAADPAATQVWNLYALCCLGLQNKTAAFDVLQSALAVNGGGADLHLSMAVVCRGLQREPAAIEHCRKALAAQPDLAAAQTMLAQLLEHAGETDDAITAYEQAALLQPELRAVHEQLFALYHNHGRNRAAAQLLATMIERWPDDGMRIRAAVRVPGFCDSTAEILEVRAGILQRVETLLAGGPLHVADPVRDIGITPFYLAYQGMNDREPMTAIARLIRRAYPGRPQRIERKHTGRIRIGIVSRYLFSHSIGRLNRGTIANLPRDKFEVTVFALDSRSDPVADAIRGAADRYVDCSTMTLRETEECIAQQAQDVLFFTDIGMEPRSYFLAFSRLAPVQCMTWGHPDTSGIDTIDYFISANACETAEAGQHYSEKLVKLKSFFLSDYAKPAAGGDVKAPGHFGFRPRRNVYLCPQALFKLHPDFDAAMAAVLRNDAAGEIVLLEGTQRAWAERLRQRWARSMPDVAGRVRFLPRMPWRDLLGAMKHADVVLDTFHFGGGNTTYEALAMGTPVVTLPAAYLRGRFTLGCYRQMKVPDCIAGSPETFA
ncbi:MAG TPA: tetratricopeptide repeat protein, partial [Burkholderiales bacterium]|nr:tetratricopeptide repeat protein [Burkholderiales bacterium]